MRWTLSVKIALGIAVILIASMGISVMLSTINARNQLMADNRHYAIHLSEIAETGLENAMIIKDPEKIKNIMQAISSRADVVASAIFNKRGEVKYSSDPSDVGHIFSKNDPVCIICHGGKLSDQTHTVILPSKQGARILKVVRPIINQPNCQGCHQERVLGMLMVDLSLAEVDQQATAVLGQQIRQSLVSAAIIIVALIGFMYLIVTRPLAHFIRITRAIGTGDLSKRVNLTRKDEIGELGASFDHMVESTAARTQELERLNAIAVTEITERKRVEQEMAIFAEIGRLISSTLEINEVYERFAAEAQKLIPFDRITVSLCNIRENIITVVYVSGADLSSYKQGDFLPLKGTLVEELLRKRTGQIIQSEKMDEIVSRIPSFFSNFQAGLRSLIGVPLINKNEATGILYFWSKTPNAYTGQDLRLAERIGLQIAGAIANTQMFIDLKQTEKSLQESVGRFRALVEQAAVGVAEIVMETGQFITVNRRLWEMVGRTEDELLATTFQAITHPEDLHLHEEQTALLLAGKIGNYSLEKRYLRKDGEIVWVKIEVSPLWKPGEKPERNMIVVEDITERKRLETEIREMSLRDLLTDLYNRRGFITMAEQQIRTADRNRRSMLLTFIDCDGLKWINDTLGHEEGDKALIDTANVLRQTFRKSDVIARLGGDEFAVLSIDAADINLEEFPRRLQQNIDAGNAKDGRPYKLAMSWGATLYDPASPMSLDEMMSSADERMYAQKKAKRNLRN